MLDQGVVLSKANSAYKSHAESESQCKLVTWLESSCGIVLSDFHQLNMRRPYNDGQTTSQPSKNLCHTRPALMWESVIKCNAHYDYDSFSFSS